MSEQTAAALDVATGDYRVTGDADALRAAARAHLDASRPLEQIKAEYDAVQDARAAGEPWDPEEKDRLAAELQPAREATEILAGHLPGSGPQAGGEVGF